MPGTATDYNVARIALTKGQLWANLAIPAASARLTLHTDGTPESGANPTAKHLGYTAEGAELLVKPSYDTYFADEDANPIKRAVGDTETVISGTLLQVTDLVLAELLTPGVGTRATGAGYDQLQIGTRAIVFSSVALIFPAEDDPTKFCVFHLYKALNDAGLAAQIARKKLAGAPFAFKGHAIGTRAAADTVGNYWRQIP